MFSSKKVVQQCLKPRRGERIWGVEGEKRELWENMTDFKKQLISLHLK